MKALTIHQPYASLIAVGAKRYETRSRPTEYRGRIAIHAGLKLIMPHENIKLWNGVMDVMWDEGYLRREHPLFGKLDGRDLYYEQFPRGAIIATAELVECWTVECQSVDSCGNRYVNIHMPPFGAPYKTLYEPEILFGDWTPGRYAWELADVQMLPDPIPVRGRQGLWNWEGAILHEKRFAERDEAPC